MPAPFIGKQRKGFCPPARLPDWRNCTKHRLEIPLMTDKKPSPSPTVPMIEAIGLSKFYGIFAAVKNVSFTVSQGELVAFLGPNGAGKSTTMKLLTGYLAPSEGIAKIAGHDMATDRLAGSAKLGYLPE